MSGYYPQEELTEEEQEIAELEDRDAWREAQEQFWIDESIKVADSYPHDGKWKTAMYFVGCYREGVCDRDGQGVPPTFER